MGEELIPLFVRLSVEQAERLDRAVAAIDARKKDVVSGLIDAHVDPDSPAGLDALRTLAGLGRGELVPAAAPGAPTAAPPTPASPSPAGVEEPTLDDPARPILTPAGAAALLGVRAVDVLELAEHGELPGRRVAGQWRFARSALVEWVAGGQPSSQRSASR